MSQPASPTRIYEACFVEMGKTLRMVQFYPITHPAFQRSLERSYLYLSQLLKRVGAFDLTIAKNALSIQDRQITGNTKVLTFLAGELFRRRVKQLHFDPATELRDYQALFRILAMEVPELQKKGGAEKTLAIAGARSIWANDLKFRATQIAEWQQEAGEEPSDFGEDELEEAEQPLEATPDVAEMMADSSTQHPELQRLLEGLIAAIPDEARFKSTLGQIFNYCKTSAQNGSHGPASVALQVMSKLTYQFGDADPQMDLLIKAIRSVATPEVVRVEISRISHAVGSAWEEHANALVPVGTAVIPFLFRALAETDSRKSRQRLILALQKFGGDVREPSLKLLADARWFVVRNAVDLLGLLKDASVAPQLTPLLKHDHVKVRLAAREALRRVGGDEALAALIDATSFGEDSDRRHAVSQLTFFPAQVVLPKVLELIDKGSPIVAEEGLRVLSELDPPDMIPFLEKTLSARKGLLGGKKRDALRRVAAELICLRLPESWSILREYASDSDLEVRKWVARGIEMMQRAKKGEIASV